MRSTDRIRTCPAYILARDTGIFTLLLLCAALLYLAAPAIFYGTGTARPDTADQANAQMSTPAPTDGAVPAILYATADPTPTPVADTPSPLPVGNFSDVFPTSDTGIDALHSYQSDTLRIAVRKVEKDGVIYFTADVWVKAIAYFRTAFAKGAYGTHNHEMPDQMAKDNQAILAVTGDYYSARDKGLVIRNGKLYRDVMYDDVCLLRTDGTLTVCKPDQINASELTDQSIWQAWAFGPALVANGAACDTSGSNIKIKNPRCAIGYYEPGHYCFVVADGRQDGYSTGMTLDELTGVFLALGCETAYNLDGGATAMMVFEGQLVNQPTKGGRASSDIICF